MTRLPIPILALRRNLHAAGWFDVSRLPFRQALGRQEFARFDVRGGQVLFRGPLDAPSCWWLRDEGEVLIADHTHIAEYAEKHRAKTAPPRREVLTLRVPGDVADWLREVAGERQATLSEVGSGLLERAYDRARGAA